jgi:acyl-CoA dehydrogenase
VWGKQAWNSRADMVLTRSTPVSRLPAKTAINSKIFTIFEGTSEIQRLVIGRTVTGLPVR